MWESQLTKSNIWKIRILEGEEEQLNHKIQELFKKISVNWKSSQVERDRYNRWLQSHIKIHNYDISEHGRQRNDRTSFHRGENKLHRGN